MARNNYYSSPHWRALKRATHERDGWKCVVPGCTTPTHRLTCDHIKRRPNVSQPTAFDVIGNTRTLCGNHDARIKEAPSGKRRGNGKLVVSGCDVTGRPIDPNHPWNRS